MSAMQPERWQRISRLLDELLDLPAAERSGRLATLCGDDAGLRAEVERLLAAEEPAAAFLELPAGERLVHLLPELEESDEEGGEHGDSEAEDEGTDPLLGSALGPWHLQRRLGRGGMGVVYLAERRGEGFVQRAAVKLLRVELDDAASLARFRRERRILARLEHPAIARLIDGGIAAGRPYVALEYVEGEPLTAGCDRRRLDVEQRLRLVLEASTAVAYAHRNLVVHRDLKPANILLTSEGHIKLVDFGIGRLLDDDEHTALTRRGELLFTPAYAAPEQLLGEPTAVVTDVYGLGLVLYELLCGRRAHRSDGSSPQEMAAEVATGEPIPPSRAVLTAGEPAAREVATARRTTPDRLRRRLAGDLDNIALMALRREPERRYASVEALAADLERHLSGHPVAARPPSRLYRARKLVRRHRIGFAAAAAVLVALVAGLGAAAWQAEERQRQALRAEREAHTAQEVTAFLVSLFAAADPAAAQGNEVSARELLEQGAARIEGELVRSPEVKSDLLLTLSEIAERLGQYERSLELAEAALGLRRDHLGPQHEKTADALLRKGSALTQLGRPAAAEEALREALALHERQRGRVSVAVARDLEHLAVVAFLGEEPDVAAPLLAEALATRERLQGGGHPDVARALGQMAVLRRQQGELAAAESLYQRAMGILDAELGEDHPETVIARNNLAALRVHQGQLAAAASLFRRVAAAHRRVHGDHHPLTVTAQNNLAVVLLKQGEASEAEGLFREVLEHWERSAGPEHPHALGTRLNLAAALRASGQLAEAESLYGATGETLERLFGRDHPHAAAAVSQLAAIALERGQAERARRLAEDALARRRATRGPEHPEVAASLQQLGDILHAGGDSEQAAELYRQAWELRRRLLGDAHPDTEVSRQALAALPQVPEGR